VNVSVCVHWPQLRVRSWWFTCSMSQICLSVAFQLFEACFSFASLQFHTHYWDLWTCPAITLYIFLSTFPFTSLSTRFKINTVVQYERVEAFKRKLHMWKTRVSSGISDMFEHTHAFIAEKHFNFKTIQHQITVHLSKVLEKFDPYFPALTEKQAADFLWIRNPFTEKIEAKLPATLPSRLLEELIEISSDASLRARFSEVPLQSFWSKIAEEHPVCHTAAMKVLIPFSTTYLCEAGFSTMTALKTNTGPDWPLRMICVLLCQRSLHVLTKLLLTLIDKASQITCSKHTSIVVPDSIHFVIAYIHFFFLNTNVNTDIFVISFQIGPIYRL